MVPPQQIPNFAVPAPSPTNPAIQHLSEHDRQLFCEYATGPSEQPKFHTVVAAFEHNADMYPNLTAAQTVDASGCVKESITFAQLNAHANTMAAVLRRQGVSNGSKVGLFVQRSIEMLVGILGVLKLGAAYIPQHVGVAPARQLQHIVSAAAVDVVLTLSRFESEIPAFDSPVSVLCIDKVMKLPHMPFSPRSVMCRPVTSNDVCYIIFTSGTTGAPKGVQVTHGNVVNVLLTAPMNLGMAPGIKVSQILSVAFDMGAWEILGALCNAATLVIRGKSIADAVKHVDVVIATPTVLGTLDVTEMRHIKTAAVAGEPCPRGLADIWSSFCEFYNACGPTETTIVNTAKLHRQSDSILTIGKPTPNNTVYVLDPTDQTACSIGEVGEMWAGGRCVSAGYLGSAELSSQKYSYDPFVDDGFSMMYKTGDLGRWTDDGELEHFGRVDDQVKIKGFRVELDGISSTLELASSVLKAVAIKANDSIVAFVTPKTADEKEAKEAVRAKLPYYCVPSKIVCVSDFPMTSNGKVDKRKLQGLAVHPCEYVPISRIGCKEVLCTPVTGNASPVTERSDEHNYHGTLLTNVSKRLNSLESK